MEPDEKLGYLTHAVERLEQRQDAVITRLDSLEKMVESKFRTAEVVFKTLKFLGYAALAILTLKFGDLPRLWAHFF
jgi:hypothetical protein